MAPCRELILGRLPCRKKPMGNRIRYTDTAGEGGMKPYLLAVVATAAVGLVRYALSGVLGETAPTIPFVVPVILAAWYGGLRPGLLATALGTLVGGYLFVPPHFSLAIESVAEA